MPDLCGALFGLLVILGVIAVIGHGLWVMVAAFFRAISEDRPNAPSKQSPGKPPDDDWAAAARQLLSMHQRGLISAERWIELRDALNAERKHFRREQAAKALMPIIVDEPAGESEAADEALEITDFVEPVTVPPKSAEQAIIPETPSDQPAKLPVLEPAPASTPLPHGGLLQAFMEEKNIRWGELVSGLLIVGSAIGLVISLWSTLKESIPYFPALLFMLSTAAIHGAGLYTLKQWKLKSTSRGLLLISTLLIPLNFLAAIALSGEQGREGHLPVTHPLYLTAVTVGLVVYGLISFSAGRVFRRKQWWPLWLAVMLPSTGQLLIARLVSKDMSIGTVNLLATLPLLGFILPMAAQLRLVSSGRHFSLRRAGQTFQMLGIGLFSMLMAVGLLVAKSGSLFGTLAALSPTMSVMAVMLTATGLLIQQLATKPSLATTRTAGTAIALSGSSLMLISLGLAWPRPELLIAVGVVDVIALTTLTLTARLPVLHLPALAATALTTLTVVHLSQGTIFTGEAATSAALIDAFLMGRSGVVLMALAVVSFAATAVWKRLDREDDGRAYVWGAAGLCVLSLGTAVVAGFFRDVDRAMTTPLFAVGTGVALTICRMRRQEWGAWIGSVLTFITVWHALSWNASVIEFLSEREWTPYNPGLLAGLCSAALSIALALVFGWRARRIIDIARRDAIQSRVIQPLCAAGLVVSALCLLGILNVPRDGFALHCGYLFAMTALWGAVAVLLRLRPLMFATQAVSFLAVGFAAVAIAQRQEWWKDNFADPRYWQIQIGLQAIWCLMWIVSRRISAGKSAGNILRTGPWSVDHIVLGGVVLATIMLSILGTLPGITTELQLATLTAEPSVFSVFLPDALAALLMLSLGVMLLFVVAGGSRGFGVPLAMCGVISIVWMSSEMTSVSAASYESAFGTSLAPASGVGTWILLGVVAVTVVATFWERVTELGLCGIVLLSGLIPVLIAGRFLDQQVTASVLRWGLVAYGLILIGALAGRQHLADISTKLRWRFQRLPDSMPEIIRAVGLSAVLWPVMAISLNVAARLLDGDVLAGPAAGTVFGQMGIGLSYAIPFWTFAAALLWVALRERHGTYASAASLLVLLGLALFYVLPIWEDRKPLGGIGLVELLQWISLGLGVTTLLWIAGRRWIESRDEHTGPVLPFQLQWGMTAGVAVCLSIGAAMAVFIDPVKFQELIKQFGHPIGLAAYAISAAAVGVPVWRRYPALRADLLTAGLVFFVPIAAAATGHLKSDDTWLTFHMLITGITTMMAGATTFAVWPQLRDRVDAGRLMPWVMTAGLVALLIGFRGQWDDPQRPWWLFGAATAVAAAITAFGIARRSQSFAYLSTGLALLATTVALSRPWLGMAAAPTPQTFLTVLELNLIALAGIGSLWLAVELYWQRRRGESFEPGFDSPPAHHVAAGLGLLITSTLVISLLFVRADGTAELASQILPVASPLGWGAVIAVTVLLLGSLWDRLAGQALPGLFACGLLIAAVVLDSRDLGLRNLWFGIGTVLAGYVTVNGGLWRQRKNIALIGRAIRLPDAQLRNEPVSRWLPVTAIVLSIMAIVIHFWVVITFADLPMRVVSGLMTAVLVPGLVGFADGHRGSAFRLIALLVAVVAALQLVWGIPEHNPETHLGLLRCVRLLEVTAVATLLYAAVLIRFVHPDHRWGRSIRWGAIISGGVSLLTLFIVLGWEAVMAARHPGVDIALTNSQIAVVSAILVGLAGGLLVLAVLQGRDPLRMTERGRMGYVYAAELVLSLLFMHIYLARPVWFHGYLRPYWPYVVMVIAYVGVGLGELFKRMQLRVLSEPLQRTATFLPLLPALAFWILASERNFNEYSLLLMLAGLMYVVLAMWRESFVYSLAAAVAGNAALWSQLYLYQTTLLTKPQLWLIPPAMSILVAAQLNRKRLSDVQLTAIRYFGITLIYVSSTAEMFLAGIGKAEAIWYPMVLMGLSVVGVLTGIVMRIRALLYLGTSFLFLSMVSMVWHAARAIEHVWPWWVFGIVLGLAILVLFGMFEKKRNDVLRVISRLKEWER